MGKVQFRHTFIVCKNLLKELIIGLDIQQFYQLGCNWTDDGCLVLPQGTNILINSIDVIMNVTHLETISTVYRFLLILMQFHQLKGLVSLMLIYHVYLRWKLLNYYAFKIPS